MNDATLKGLGTIFLIAFLIVSLIAFFLGKKTEKIDKERWLLRWYHVHDIKNKKK